VRRGRGAAAARGGPPRAPGARRRGTSRARAPPRPLRATAVRPVCWEAGVQRRGERISVWHGAQVTRLSSECAHLRARAARLREQRDRAEAALAAARAVYDDALANPGRRRSTREAQVLRARATRLMRRALREWRALRRRRLCAACKVLLLPPPHIDSSGRHLTRAHGGAPV
jgi:hypothetical protein